MIWVKQEGAGVLPGYTCSNCGALWITVEKDRRPPEECKACGEKAEVSVDG